MGAFGQKFGDLVRARRGAAGLTQEALAERAFGDPARMSRISELENGRVARPQQRTVAALAAALDIDQADIQHCRDGAAPRPPEQPAAMAPQSPESARTEALLHALANAFGVDAPDLGVRDLAKRIKGEATELKRLKAEAGRHADAKAALVKLAKDAETAWRAGDPAAVAKRLAEVEAAHARERTLPEVEAQANIRQARAEALLQAGDADGAADAFDAAAALLAPFQTSRAFDRRIAGVKRLMAEAGMPGTAAAAAQTAADMLSDVDQATDPESWARIKTWRGAALAVSAEAAETTDLIIAGLNAAIEEICDALQVFTADAHPMEWAWTQGWLGRALAAQAAVAPPDQAPRIRAMAVGAYRNGLKGRDLATDRDAAAIAAALSELAGAEAA